jgi:hypothetical protein
VTNLNIYNFKKKSKFKNFRHYILDLRRVIAIKNVAGLTKLLYKTKPGPKEFVIHVTKAHDYRLLSEE